MAIKRHYGNRITQESRRDELEIVNTVVCVIHPSETNQVKYMT
jgi:hypothetical protein